MNQIAEILSEQIKPKEKQAKLVEAVLQKQITAKEFMDYFVSAPDVDKGNCAAAMKHISASNPEILAPYIDTLLEFINHKLPRVKWGVPEAIGNLSKSYPEQTAKAIPNLLKNSTDAKINTTVIKWCAAYALTEIARNNPLTRSRLLPVFEERVKNEKNNGVKNVYRRFLEMLPLMCVSYLILNVTCLSPDSKNNSGYPITPVSFTKIQLTDAFWLKRIETNQTVTIPFGFEKCEAEGRIRNFARAGGLLKGEYEGKMPFDDSDVYKIIEGASYSLSTHPDKELEKYMDAIIVKIAAAQEDDGYLCTWKTLNPATTPAAWVKPGPRWHHLSASHELYNVGHLYEAAFAHYQATGKRNLLEIALKNADLIAETFGPGKKQTPPGHQIIETGLVKLFLATQDKKYLDLAKFFLDQRGNAQGHELYGAYCQDHQLVVEQTEAVGHAVRAVYMYAGMADIAGIRHDSAYLNAIDKIWENVVAKKLYLTGGIGARHQGEAFGDDYELPNLTSYNETCAAIGNVYWNHRMFLLHGDAKYIDVLERTLYNGLISGVSLTGDSFFYPNCLESDGEYKFNVGTLTRQPWFDCSCCPSNVIRFIPSVPEYIYAQRNDSLYVNLFIAGKVVVDIGNRPVEIQQETQYPWDGKVAIKVNPGENKKFAINIRIPGWAVEKPVPGDLYRFLIHDPQAVTLKVNGQLIDLRMKNGFAVIDRQWSPGDRIELDLPMPVRRVIAHEMVEADRDKVAFVRGPLVYCAEGIDNEKKVRDLVVPDTANFTTEPHSDLLGGVTVIKGTASDKSGRERKIILIPYYAWSHRGVGEMAVWLSRKAVFPK